MVVVKQNFMFEKYNTSRVCVCSHFRYNAADELILFLKNSIKKRKKLCVCFVEIRSVVK